MDCKWRCNCMRRCGKCASRRLGLKKQRVKLKFLVVFSPIVCFPFQNVDCELLVGNDRSIYFPHKFFSLRFYSTLALCCFSFHTIFSSFSSFVSFILISLLFYCIFFSLSLFPSLQPFSCRYRPEYEINSGKVI